MPPADNARTEVQQAKRRRVEKVDSVTIESRAPAQAGRDIRHPIAVDDAASSYTDRVTLLSQMSADGKLRPGVSEYRATERTAAYTPLRRKRRHRQLANHQVPGDRIEDSLDGISSSSGALSHAIHGQCDGATLASPGPPEYTVKTRASHATETSPAHTSPYFASSSARNPARKMAGVKRRNSDDDVDELSHDVDSTRPSKANKRPGSSSERSGAFPRSLSSRGDMSRSAFPPKANVQVLASGLRLRAAVGTPRYLLPAENADRESEGVACILQPEDLSTILVPTSTTDARRLDFEWAKVNLRKIRAIHCNPDSALILIRQPSALSAPAHLFLQLHEVSDARKLVAWAKDALTINGVDYQIYEDSPYVAYSPALLRM